MKVTRQRLEKIIKEEMQNVLNEGMVKNVLVDELVAFMKGKEGMERRDVAIALIDAMPDYDAAWAAIAKLKGEEPAATVEGLTRAQAKKAWAEMEQARRDREARERGEKEDTSVDLGFDLKAMMQQNEPEEIAEEADQ